MYGGVTGKAGDSLPMSIVIFYSSVLGDGLPNPQRLHNYSVRADLA
jgi:hypothetical protein